MCREIFEAYVAELKTKKVYDKDKKTYELKYPFAQKKDDAFWEDCYNKIKATGLKFDPKHITINENGVSYDYVAYKNKMLLAYPESLIDIELVYAGDEFSFSKSDGKITYHHVFANPFEHNEKDIIGGYCVIKNKRGEFLTTLSRPEIEKARKVAKTQSIWSQWYSEMCRKTVIKKAVKFHFDDVYTSMEEEDNKQYDIEKTVDDTPEFPTGLINAINAAESTEKLKELYKREYQTLGTKELKAEFVARCTARKQELQREAGK